MMRDDPDFKPIMLEYGEREQGTELWLREFGEAFKKVTELGLPVALGGRGADWGDARCEGSAQQLRGGGCPFAAAGAARRGKPMPEGHPPV